MDAQSEKLLLHILRSSRVAALGTSNDEEPRVSMVSFVPAPDFCEYHIHVSRLAQHTVDMQKNRQVSLLITEADDGRPDPQTLGRLSIRGSAEFMENGEPGYTPAKARGVQPQPRSPAKTRAEIIFHSPHQTLKFLETFRVFLNRSIHADLETACHFRPP